MKKLFLALSIAVLTAGCTIAPVRYVPVAATAAPAQTETTTVVTPVYVQPTYYYDPFAIVAGVILLRGVRGWHSGHGGHHRR